MISFSDFEKIDIRVGTIIDVQDFPEAKKPAYQLKIDFGSEIGIKKSSAQIVAFYTKESLIGKQVLAVVNFPEKRIGPFVSEVLVLGVNNPEGKVVLITPDSTAPNGVKLY